MRMPMRIPKYAKSQAIATGVANAVVVVVDVCAAHGGWKTSAVHLSQPLVYRLLLTTANTRPWARERT
jgi:hypothetical protein